MKKQGGCETTFPRDCPMCGKSVKPEHLYVWHVTCSGCYDGAPDACKQLFGWHFDRSKAIKSWNEQVAEYEADRDEARRELETDRRIDERRGK